MIFCLYLLYFILCSFILIGINEYNLRGWLTLDILGLRFKIMMCEYVGTYRMFVLKKGSFIAGLMLR